MKDCEIPNLIFFSPRKNITEVRVFPTEKVDFDDTLLSSEKNTKTIFFLESCPNCTQWII